MSAGSEELERRFWKWVQMIPFHECWEWMGHGVGRGYGRISIGGRQRLVHRVAYELFCGPIPPGLLVCHRCDNTRCVRPDHLFVGTNKDNLLDAGRKGRLGIDVRPASFRLGTRHHSAKLDDAKVRWIRANRGVISQRKMAEMLGVDQRAVCMAQNRQTWTHVAEAQ